ncbi:MAG: cation transporter [Thermoanaerobaculia bacterium]
MKKRLACLLLAFASACMAIAETKTVTFTVRGWTCGSCAGSTRIALKKVEGVEAVKTDLEKAEAAVTYDDAKTTVEKIVQAIERLGYKATVKGGSASLGSPAAASVAIGSEPVSFFEVPLECGAAEGLGCGIRSKPILKRLEKDPSVKEAKINRPGTVLAVLWKDPAHASAGVSTVEAAFKESDLETAVLRGEDREKAQKEFDSKKWYTAADVDRLSEREAEVIAARLINRAKPRLNLSPDRLAALSKDLTAGIAKVLTRDGGEECAVDPTEELTAIASKHLNAQQLAELRKAADQGVGALPGEMK